MHERVELGDVYQITRDALVRYLMATGWTRRTLREAMARPSAEPIELFSREAGGHVGPPIILPSKSAAVDLYQRVRDAVQVLAEMEERAGYQVIDSIRRVGYDVVRSTIPSEQVIDDTIRLASAAEFVSQMRGLLAATATTEKRPRPYFGRLLKDSVQFADGCRFGHTYHGSFGFVIESPLPDQSLTPLLADAPPTPFERRVLQRFARGISSVVDAVSARTTAPIVNSVNVGFSANGCEQFADLIEAVSPVSLKFSFDLSPAWSLDRSMDGTEFVVSASHAELCKSAARELRRDDTSTEVNVAGRVVRLQNQTDPTDLTSQTGEHEIVILWSSFDLGDVQVRTNLSPGDYLGAVSAHGQGRPVWISGTLVRLGRQWVLNNPRDFRVPRQEELEFGDDGVV
jgi:hypothetical protein